jgi:hypothetical protein
MTFRYMEYLKVNPIRFNVQLFKIGTASATWVRTRITDSYRLYHGLRKYHSYLYLTPIKHLIKMFHFVSYISICSLSSLVTIWGEGLQEWERNLSHSCKFSALKAEINIVSPFYNFHTILNLKDCTIAFRQQMKPSIP